MATDSLWLRTTDNWGACTLTWDDGGGAQVWTCGATVRSAYEAAADLAAWILATYGDTLTVDWARLLGGCKLTLTTLAAYTLVANAASQSLLGLAAAYGAGSTFVGAAAAAGTWSPLGLGMTRLARWQTGTGDRSGMGCPRVDSPPGTALQRPVIEAVGDPTDAARLTSLWPTARAPTQGYVYRVAFPSWTLLAVGLVRPARQSAIRWRWTVEAVA